MKIAHLSDLHFSCITWHPRQFLSKRWLGNWNHILFRQRTYQTSHLHGIPSLLETLKVEQVFLTGDFSTTSLEEEFLQASQLIKTFHQPVFYLPGNHDCYTKEAEEKKLFYDYFPSEGLKTKRVVSRPIGENWWWIGLDCALATPPFYSYGRFTTEMEKPLQDALAAIPSDAHILFGNHFPLIPSGRPRHDLARADVLQEIIRRDGRVKLYLHGHDHAPYIIDRQAERLPLVLNAGSCAYSRKGTFYFIDLQRDSCLLQRYIYNANEWKVDQRREFSF